jgi:hypothetical protein
VSEIIVQFEEQEGQVYQKTASYNQDTGVFTTDNSNPYNLVTASSSTLPDGVYSVKVLAFDANGASTDKTLQDKITIDTTSPVAPANLQVTAKTPHSVTLNWTGSTSPDTTGYRLYWGTEQGKYTNVRDIGNVTNYTLNGLNPVTTYYFKVIAYDKAGNSSVSSNEVNEKTPAEISGGGAISSGGGSQGGIVESAQAASPQNENKAEGQNEEQKTQTKGKNNLFLVAIIILILGVAGFYYINTHSDKLKKVKFPKLPGLNNK